MIRKLLLYMLLLFSFPGMIPGFLSVRLLHAKQLLEESKEVVDENSAGALFMGYSAGWALLIYVILSYFMFA